VVASPKAIRSQTISSRRVRSGAGPERIWLRHDVRVTFPETGAVITAIASDYAGAAGGHSLRKFLDLNPMFGETLRRRHHLIGVKQDLADAKPLPQLKQRSLNAVRKIDRIVGRRRENVVSTCMPAVADLPDFLMAPNTCSGWARRPFSVVTKRFSIMRRQTEAWLAEMRRSLRPNQ